MFSIFLNNIHLIIKRKFYISVQFIVRFCNRKVTNKLLEKAFAIKLHSWLISFLADLTLYLCVITYNWINSVHGNCKYNK